MILFCSSSLAVWAQDNTNQNKFKQLKEELATPNVYRTASGAPGHAYWQMKADYDMQIELDDATQKIYGTAKVVYHNQSPDVLSYIWLQLDQNMRAQDSDTYKIRGSSFDDGRNTSMRSIKRIVEAGSFDGGFKIDYVKDASGKVLSTTTNQTMMRIDLPKDLQPGESFTFNIKWWYNINDRMAIGGRSGYEYFKKDGNYLYTIAQFYPRLAVYNEVEGWQNKQFLGSGEFALTFGDYKVAITVPADHVVASTGTLSNPKEVLTSEQRKRYDEAKTAKEPVIIISQEEAEENEKEGTDKKKTWVYEAENVRDFGFASSRKFIWDAMGVKQGDRTIMAMSYYPKEGNPLWEQYSTKVVAHTLNVYSKHTFDYPYPVAISVHAARIGMEYPMICFNFGRPNPDGTYSARTKYGMIGVIIHEVGHNDFPMIVNSDERQWTWMDEGLNSFLQFLTEQEWERDYPSRRGPAKNITRYMKGDKNKISPIMTNSESIWQFGNNAYGKPATALNILRETIMGRELFDYAFKEYSQRWMFKHPTPADFFRTMEDASAVDLDWFWRGWFYTNDHVDIALEEVNWFKLDNQDPELAKSFAKEQSDQVQTIYQIRNQESIKETFVEADPTTADFYNNYNPFQANALDKKEYEQFYSRLDEDEKAILNKGYNFYELKFKNVGGLVMPLIIQFEYVDGSTEIEQIPAEIWKINTERVSKVFFKEKEVVQISIDPFLQTADTDTGNNFWPPKPQPSRFEIFKNRSRSNPMQRARESEEIEKKGGMQGEK
ncbi:MAG: M1 family metallopeptidase [Bacteroidota bacterium]